MSKTRKSRGASRASSAPGPTGRPFLLAGFIAGIACTLGFQWLLESPLLRGGGGVGMASPAAVEREEFEFYTLLGNLRVAVPEPDTSARPEDNAVYWLQAGSFRNRDDAENLRVSLLLMNMEAEIRTVSQEGVTWHRVVAGPFESRSIVARARDSLVREGIHPITLRQEIPR